MYFYEVAPLQIVRASNAVYTYSSETPLAIGCFVCIPIGKKQLIGILIRAVTAPAFVTKPITEILNHPPLTSELIETAVWMSQYYAVHLATVLQAILPRGIGKKRRERVNKLPGASRKRTHFLFNKQQLDALAAIERATPGTIILHGITGGGKTAVYIEQAKRVIVRGKSVVILLPEIALTSQLVAEFQHHFDNIILTHSRQTEAERHAAWLDAATSQEPRVVVGPRSALFTPLATIGLIVIDEAHEPSFKQDQSPRYSALRVASVLGKLHGAHIIQGSATPLASEYYLAQQANRPIIRMDSKANPKSVEPTIEVVDMTKKSHFNASRHFSSTFLDTLRHTLDAGHQALVFHNRRGSASTTLCEHCGWSALCPRCFVPYTLHADSHQLICHICNDTARVPTSCPECRSTEIIHKGIGTKLIEAELKKLFPDKKIARFDGDANQDNTVEKRYQELYDGSIDIIIGTQVIAKGLDLPHLRMVGVVQADTGLVLPDFMATERCFQLLAQVIGRVGRSIYPTTVIVQSYQPLHPAVQLGIAQDYDAFYQQTLAQRHRALFPPFRFLLKLTCIYKTEVTTIRNAQKLASLLRKDFPGITIFGPMPSFYERQHDTYRWQIIVKSSHRQQLLDMIKHVPSTHWQADIDPMSLL